MNSEEDAVPEAKLKTIRALLAKAEGTTNEEERDAFNAKAAELIAKYGIDQALLANASEVREEVGDRIIEISDPYARQKGTLLHFIAVPMRVRAVLRNRARGADQEVHLFGFTADLDRVELLFTSLLLQATFGMALAAPTNPYEDIKTYRRSWLIGFANAIGQRVREAEDRAKKEASVGTPGVALVLASRDQEVALRVKEIYPRLVNKSSRLSGSGYGAGRAAGNRADLGGTRIGGSSTRGIAR